MGGYEKIGTSPSWWKDSSWNKMFGRTSTFSFFVPGEGWKHVKLEAGEAFVASRLWFAKFFHFASASEETIRMIVR